MFTVLFGCHVELFQPQKLAQAKSLWVSKSIVHYEELIRFGCLTEFPCFSEVKMEVKDNQVIYAESRGILMMSDPFKPITQEQFASGKLQNYTIDSLFQQATSATQGMGFVDINGRIYLDFDSELGFVSRFTVNDCGQGGLLGHKMGHCSSNIIVKSVKPIN